MIKYVFILTTLKYLITGTSKQFYSSYSTIRDEKKRKKLELKFVSA